MTKQLKLILTLIFPKCRDTEGIEKADVEEINIVFLNCGKISKCRTGTHGGKSLGVDDLSQFSIDDNLEMDCNDHATGICYAGLICRHLRPGRKEEESGCIVKDPI